MYLAFSAVVAAALGTFVSTVISSSFDPSAHAKDTVYCPAVNRSTNETVAIKITYVDINPGAHTTIIMVHGWPSLWSSWSHQIQNLKNDYHLIALDQRGFAESTHPDDVQSSSIMADLVGDLACLLQHVSVETAICLGHDWGAEVCYEAARMRPDIFMGVVGITVPYLHSAGPFLDSSRLKGLSPHLSYQSFFEQHTAQATAELNTDVRRSLRATLRTVDSPPPPKFLTSTNTYLGDWNNITNIPPIPFFSPIEEDYFVDQYNKQKFNYTLFFYTYGNRYGTWQFAQAQGNYTIHQPVLSVLPTEDPVANWTLAEEILKSAQYLPRLTTETIEGAHWPHLENPDTFNTILRKWLDVHFASLEPSGRLGDEL